jgi:hypothetical protein
LLLNFLIVSLIDSFCSEYVSEEGESVRALLYSLRPSILFRPSPIHCRPSRMHWRPSALSWRPSALYWRPSALYCRPSPYCTRTLLSHSLSCHSRNLHSWLLIGAHSSLTHLTHTRKQLAISYISFCSRVHIRLSLSRVY